MNKKGVVTLFIAFMIAALIIVVIAAIFAPMGVLFNAEAYKAGEDILLRANSSIQSIQDTEVRDSVTSNVNAAFVASEENININANIFQYGWIAVVGLTAIIVFLFTRATIEFGSGGFV